MSKSIKPIIFFLLTLLLVACAGNDAEVVEVQVTRIVTETEIVEVEGEAVEVEVTRIVTVAETEILESPRDSDDESASANDASTGAAAGGDATDLNNTDALPPTAPDGGAIAANPNTATEEESLYQPLKPTAAAPVDMQFQDAGVNPFVTTKEDPLSTFAIDVDTGAYTIMRRYLTDSLLPPASAVRLEEFVNYFDYNYPLPTEDDTFAIHIDGAPSPYTQGDNYRFVRVGIQGYDVAEIDRPDAFLIFVIDVSGSMDRDNRLGLVKESLRTLVNNLRPTDQIGIVTYGSTARVLLEPTMAVADRTILGAIDSLQTEGSTNAEDGLRLAYDLAARFAQPGNINRLILCSDGVANVGATTADTILENAKNGIPLSTFGFGIDSYNDVLMEQLADQGDGTYAYIDTLDEAERVFNRDLTSTIFTIAQDVKIQVEFNEAVIQQYRLLGYENRDVADSDFRNDAVDAGEIGAGHSVTAIYEVQLVPDAPSAVAALTVRVRYADPNGAEINEVAVAAATRNFATTFEETTPEYQLSIAVAQFAELMRGSFWARNNDLDTLATDARRIARLLPQDQEAQEFAALVAQAAALLR
ncbi:MAG TPA: von Willebrand factor type A domain-containing protein [Anaerolineae bacterium]|nr:von Willebrand factor type A domain-containing protein [Anaerolineae bacterium]